MFETFHIVTADGSTSIHAEVSQNGLNHLSELPSSGATVSLSPDAAVKEADTADLSPSSRASSQVSHTGMSSSCHLICC